MSTEKVEIDVRDVAAKLSFLVGRTILFRDWKEDACTATQVLAVTALNRESPTVSIYTTVGIQHIDKSEKFGNIMLINDYGGIESLAKTTDNLGIVF